VITGMFEYHAPEEVQEAVALLAEHGDEAKVLAGGHSLVPLMKLRLATPSVIVDLNRIAALRGISQSDGSVTIGAMTTHAAIEHSADLKAALPVLPAAATLIGDPMVRNRGTIGGSLVHADPAGDWPAVALALDARMHLVGPVEERTVRAEEFFVDLLTSAVEPGEILTEIEIAISVGRFGMSYQKFAHPASGYAVTGVAAILVLDEASGCADCRVAITGAGATPVRAVDTEAALKGTALDDGAIAHAADLAVTGIDFLGDLYASEEYRKQLVRVYTRRAVIAALHSATRGTGAVAAKTI